MKTGVFPIKDRNGNQVINAAKAPLSCYRLRCLTSGHLVDFTNDGIDGSKYSQLLTAVSTKDPKTGQMGFFLDEPLPNGLGSLDTGEDRVPQIEIAVANEAILKAMAEHIGEAAAAVAVQATKYKAAKQDDEAKAPKAAPKGKSK